MIEKRLLGKTNEAVKALYQQEVQDGIIRIEKTNREFQGDFTVIVFQLSRISHKSPEATAHEIGKFLLGQLPEIREFNVVKGFLNLVLTDDYWIGFLLNNAGHELFSSDAINDGSPVIVEFSSPNTNKPLHLGHIRNNLLGSSVSEILKVNGYKVLKVNLVNDRGIHICKSMLAYRLWGHDETPGSSGKKGDHLIGDYYVLFEKNYREQVRELMGQGIREEEAEQKAQLMVEAREILRKWESGDPETIGLWRRMNQWAYEGFDVTYRRLGVSFDKIQYESDTYLLGRELVKKGNEEGLLFRKEDGSIWADLKPEGLDEKLLLRSDGTSVYMTQDIGTAHERYESYHPSKLIYVVGNEQNYHFEVLGKVLLKLGYTWSDRIHHMSYGMVELPEGKMKSREGTVVDADDLMDEMFRTAEETTRVLGKVSEFSDEEAEELFRVIGLGALKYFILKVDPRKNMLFDPAESIDFNGNTGPFIQYTFARIQSLLRKAGITDIRELAKSIQEGYPADHGVLILQEKNIAKLLHQFPVIVKQAGDELNPSVIANFVFELAKEYNQFYQEIPVLKEEDKYKVALRLLLSGLTGRVIKSSMKLLGIEVPDRM